MNQISQIYSEDNLQFWKCIKIKEFNLFVNVVDGLIIYHPPFLLDDLDVFLVRNLVK